MLFTGLCWFICWQLSSISRLSKCCCNALCPLPLPHSGLIGKMRCGQIPNFWIYDNENEFLHIKTSICCSFLETNNILRNKFVNKFTRRSWNTSYSELKLAQITNISGRLKRNKIIWTSRSVLPLWFNFPLKKMQKCLCFYIYTKVWVISNINYNLRILKNYTGNECQDV